MGSSEVKVEDVDVSNNVAQEHAQDMPDVSSYHEIMTEEFEANDTRIAMIGNVDSGKSTLIGVLTNAALDDGRGAARGLVLKHRHEQENGRTSAVTVEIMGYKGKHLMQYYHNVRKEIAHFPSIIHLVVLSCHCFSLVLIAIFLLPYRVRGAGVRHVP